MVTQEVGEQSSHQKTDCSLSQYKSKQHALACDEWKDYSRIDPLK